MHQSKPPSKAKLVSSHTVTDYNTHVINTFFFSESVIQYTKILDSNVRKLLYFNTETENILSELWELLWSDISVTSHGKSPSDALGGTTKHQAVAATLQAPYQVKITTPHSTWNFTGKWSWSKI